MSRKIGNETVMELGGGHGHRGSRNGAPAQETANSRTEVIGPFRRANLTASMTPTAMTLGGVDADAPNQILAHSAGRVLGLIYGVNALITAGGASSIVVQPTVAPAGVAANVAVAGNSVAIASAATGNPQNGVVDQTASDGFSFKKGDGLGMEVVSTSAGLTPATTDDLAAWLIVRWAPSPGSPA